LFMMGNQIGYTVRPSRVLRHYGGVVTPHGRAAADH
jgi:hypothetical protein